MGRIPNLHQAADAFAMWIEDRVAREPQPFRAAPAEPLGCWGPLPELPPPPRDGERWSTPSPDPAASARGDRMVVRSHGCARPARGTTIVVPPWKTRSEHVVSGYVALARRAGWRVWVLTPPHHLERTRPGARSGEGFVSLDLGALRGVFEQLVLELRVLAALAAREGPAGVVGLSLGGLAAALAATAPEPLDHAVLLAPAADLGSVLTRTPIGARYRELARRSGSPLPAADELRGQLRCFAAAERAPTAARVFIATGSEDVIVPPEGPLALAEAWGVRPRVYRRGHLSLLFASRALRRDLAAFLAEPTSSPRRPSPPEPASSPAEPRSSPPEPRPPSPTSGTRREP